MAKLPFVVQPKRNIEVIQIGDEESGIIEIERKGYLSVAEKAFVDSFMQGSDGVSYIVQLANRLSRELKVAPEKAYLAITEAMAGKLDSKVAVTVNENYGQELSVATAKMSDSMQRRAIAAATILLQTRVNHEWTVDDTLGLDPIILDDLSKLYDREENKETVKPKTDIEEAAEIVGK
jgi:hypothetical protein